MNLQRRVLKIEIQTDFCLSERNESSNLVINNGADWFIIRLNLPYLSPWLIKSFKNNIDDYLNLSILEKTDISYPKRNYSLVCSPKNDEEIGTSFLVFPYKESLFTIKENDNYYKGYWKDKIKWLDKFKENELWTENECILIKKSIWDNILN